MSPPDLRYHIASLAAVFLALGIGILIGTAFVGAPVVDRQTRLIRGLEGSVTDIRRETAQRQGSEDALRALLPPTLRGKLAGRRVLVIQTGPYTDAADSAADSLRLAGAMVERAVLPSEAWRQASDAAAGTLPSPGPVAAIDRYAAMADDARRIGTLLAAADDAALADFRQRGLLTGDASLSGAAHYAVLVGGGANVPGSAAASPDEPWVTLLARSVDIPLAESLTERGVTVVGTEPFDAGVSFMRLYQGAGMATIDCIDRAVGRLTLPFALNGEKAAYGLKSSAERLLPASLERAAADAAAATQSSP